MNTASRESRVALREGRTGRPPATNWSLLFGFDIFISYKRREAAVYANELYARLRAEDFLCFLDDHESPAGSALTRSIERALDRSRVLVLIASPEALQSEWVGREVERFGSAGRPIIPINLQGSLSKPTLAETSFRFLNSKDVVWIDEDPEIPPSGHPSDKVIGSIQRLFVWRRAKRNVQLLTAGAIAALLGFSVFSFFQKQAADRSREEAVIEATRANREARRANDASIEAENQRDAAEKSAIEATKQRNEAVQQQRLAEERSRLAQSRALASDSRRTTAQEFDSALLTSVQAYRVSPTLDAKIALLENLSRVSKVKQYFHCPGSTFATSVAFSPDAHQLAFACQSRIMLVDLKTAIVTTRELPGEDIRALAFFSSDKIAIGGQPDLRILPFPKGAILRFAAHVGKITAITVSAEEEMLFSGDDKGEVRAWSLTALRRGEAASETLRSLPSKVVESLTYQSKVRTLRVISYSGEYLISNIDSGQLNAVRYRDFESRSSGDSPCADKYPKVFRYAGPESISADNRWQAYLTERNEIIVHDGHGCLSPLLGHTHNLSSLAFGGKEPLLASAGQIGRNRHGVILWDLSQVHPLAKVLIRFPHASFADLYVSLSSDGSSWACSGCSDAILWNGIPLPLGRTESWDARVTDIALSPSGGALAVGRGDGRVFIAERGPNGVLIKEGPRHFKPVKHVWFVSDALFALDQDGTVEKWAKGIVTSVHTTTESEESTGCRETRTDGTILEMDLWTKEPRARVIGFADLLRGTRRTVILPDSPHSCSSAAYATKAHVGVRLSSGYDPIYILKDSQTVQISFLDNPLHAISGLPTVLEHARISESGELLAATSNAESVLLLDIPSRRLLGDLAIAGVRAVALSPRGNRLLTVSEDGIVLWNLDSEKWATLADHIAGMPER